MLFDVYIPYQADVVLKGKRKNQIVNMVEKVSYELPETEAEPVMTITHKNPEASSAFYNINNKLSSNLFRFDEYIQRTREDITSFLKDGDSYHYKAYAKTMFLSLFPQLDDILNNVKSSNQRFLSDGEEIKQCLSDNRAEVMAQVNEVMKNVACVNGQICNVSLVPNIYLKNMITHTADEKYGVQITHRNDIIYNMYTNICIGLSGSSHPYDNVFSNSVPVFLLNHNTKTFNFNIAYSPDVEIKINDRDFIKEYYESTNQLYKMTSHILKHVFNNISFKGYELSPDKSRCLIDFMQNYQNYDYDNLCCQIENLKMLLDKNNKETTQQLSILKDVQIMLTDTQKALDSNDNDFFNDIHFDGAGYTTSYDDAKLSI